MPFIIPRYRTNRLEPAHWVDRPTRIVWDWIRTHPDLIAVLSETARAVDGDLRGHVADYLVPLAPDHSPLAALAHAALDEVDWNAIRLRILAAADGVYV